MEYLNDRFRSLKERNSSYQYKSMWSYNKDGPLKDIIETQYSRKDEESCMLVLDLHTKDFLSSVIQNIDTSLSKDEIWQCQNVCSFSHVIAVVRELSYYID